jgi:hypothetical protein
MDNITVDAVKRLIRKTLLKGIVSSPIDIPNSSHGAAAHPARRAVSA